jgi:O-acetyl-ADP-ribose deacetylase (regulator of RNase III)
MSSKIKLVQGDITLMHVDAIINAANNTLLGGGGVDGAIHRAAGPDLLKACRLLNGCDTGDSKITGGFRLYARYVIHTVGPVWKGGNANESKQLSNCYQRSLQLAMDHHLKTVAFPNISTGVYGFPKELAAQIAFKTVKEFLDKIASSMEVTFVVFDEENDSIYNRLLGEL